MHPGRKPAPGKLNIAALLAVYALGLLSSYIFPPAFIVFILAMGLLVLGVCQIKC